MRAAAAIGCGRGRAGRRYATVGVGRRDAAGGRRAVPGPPPPPPPAAAASPPRSACEYRGEGPGGFGPFSGEASGSSPAAQNGAAPSGPPPPPLRCNGAGAEELQAAETALPERAAGLWET